jgi:hypothetical protein
LGGDIAFCVRLTIAQSFSMVLLLGVSFEKEFQFVGQQ